MAETLISAGVLTRENDISFIAPAPLEAGAAIVGPTVKGPVEIPTLVTSYGQYQNTFGVTFTSGSTKQEFLTSLAVKSYFNNGGNSVLVTRVTNGSFTSAEDTGITPASGSTVPFTIKTIGQGAVLNSSSSLNSDGSLTSGTADNLRWEISNVDNSTGTFSLLVRRGDDSTSNKIILETWNDLSLDPSTPNYIEAVIGNQYKQIATDGSTKYIKTLGEYTNKSNYIYISGVNRQTLNYLSTDGVTVNNDSDNNSFSGSLPSAGSGTFESATGNLVSGGENYFGDIASADTQGLTGTDYDDAISLLNNQDEYVFNIISVPGLTKADHATQVDAVISLAESRGDCIAVVDLDGYDTAIATAVQAAQGLNSSYAATYYPWLQMQSSTGKLVWVPTSVVIP
jgi:hypothetical protein